MASAVPTTPCAAAATQGAGGGSFCQPLQQHRGGQWGAPQWTYSHLSTGCLCTEPASWCTNSWQRDLSLPPPTAAAEPSGEFTLLVERSLFWLSRQHWGLGRLGKEHGGWWRDLSLSPLANPSGEFITRVSGGGQGGISPLPNFSSGGDRW